MLVGIYARDKLSVYVFYIMSSSCRGANLCSFYLPMSAISLLKSPHSICVVWMCVYLSFNGLLYGWN